MIGAPPAGHLFGAFLETDVAVVHMDAPPATRPTLEDLDATGSEETTLELRGNALAEDTQPMADSDSFEPLAAAADEGAGLFDLAAELRDCIDRGATPMREQPGRYRRAVE